MVSQADAGQRPKIRHRAGASHVSETLIDFPSVSADTSRDTKVEAFTDGGAMSDPMTRLRDRTNPG